MAETRIFNTYTKRRMKKSDKKKASLFLSSLKTPRDGLSKKCPICKRVVSSFCKSHSLPRFVLKNISPSGKILTGVSFRSDDFKGSTGVNNTLTFSSICRECDGKYFQEYENEKVFFDKLSDIAINEIAVKNHLRYAYKQEQQMIFLKAHFKKVDKYPPEFIAFLENRLFLTELALKDTNNLVIKLLNKKDAKNFYVIDEIDLDYKTQIAYQGFVTLRYGFDNLIVNDTYNYDPKYKIQHLGICIIPHSKGTKILLFCEDGATRMKYFYKKYKTLALDEKLYVINYILLMCEEEWVLDAEFDKKKLNKDTLILINQRDDVSSYLYSEEELKNYKIPERLLIDTFQLKTEGNIYNFLEQKNKE